MQKPAAAITIIAYMNETYETKKYGADKIVLLGLLVLAVLIARFIIASRSAIVLTEPINLSYTGLSVSMPSGNGWRSQKQWKHHENGFALRSAFAPGSGSVTAAAYCRYLLAAPRAAPDARFKQKAANVGGEIVKIDQTQTDSLTIDWAHIKRAETLFEMFFGTVQLPNNRQFDIEVRQNTADTELAEKVFKRIAESLKFKDNPLLNSGSEIVAKIKRAGIARLLYNRNQQTFFLIKDAAKRTIGFTMDVLVDSASNAKLNIQAASLLYLRDRYAKEQATIFQSDNSFDQFESKSEISGITVRVGTEMVLGTDGLMTIRKSNQRGQEKIYQLGPAAIPELLLEFVFRQIFDSDHKEIIVDIIEADGTITPALIWRTTEDNKHPQITQKPSSTEVQSTIAAKDEAAYILNMQLLNGKGFSEKVYLDKQRQVFKRLLQKPDSVKGIRKPLHRKDTHTIERTSLDNILEQFPERTNRIMQNIKMFEQNRPQQ